MIGINNKVDSERFIVSRSNKKVFDKCNDLILNSKDSAKVLFVYGSSPCGKTSLLYSAAHLYKDIYNEDALLVSCRQIVDDLVESVKMHNYEMFFEKYCKSSLLLIDDVQCIVNLDVVQKEFSEILTKLIISGVNVIIASELPPKQYDVLLAEMLKRKLFDICKINKADSTLRKTVIYNALSIEDLNISTVLKWYLIINKRIEISAIRGCIQKIKLMKNINGDSPSNCEIISSLKSYEK